VTIEAIVQAAILERRALSFTYEGDNRPERTGHPHALFLGASGETLVDIFQVAGFTSTGALPAWRSFNVDRILAARKLDSTYELAPGWDPDGPKYAGGIMAMV
jgi:predicted DNA-binding transcriptional regulator YafY